MTIEIYTKPGCGHCTMAKQALFDNGMAYVERVLGVDFTREFILEHYPGQKTYPIIVIEGMNVGGYEGLKNYITLNNASDDNRKFLVE